eukprot:TRINITY_DN2559_c0_g1_i4.p1 TRINITY_DN2559_c0_g1~~TRINITY_DN2559_c0_g1_i4.p1  ORF type:complete len:127 (+),score=38.18 TRINITY_DN2559_c0_g1_i4:621-1001(+)
MNDLMSGEDAVVYRCDETKGGRIFMGGAIERPFILNAISPKNMEMYKGIKPGFGSEEYEAAVNERKQQQLADNFDVPLGKNWKAKYQILKKHLKEIKEKNGGTLEDIRSVYENHPPLPPVCSILSR